MYTLLHSCHPPTTQQVLCSHCSIRDRQHHTSQKRCSHRYLYHLMSRIRDSKLLHCPTLLASVLISIPGILCSNSNAIKASAISTMEGCPDLDVYFVQELMWRKRKCLDAGTGRSVLKCEVAKQLSVDRSMPLQRLRRTSPEGNQALLDLMPLRYSWSCEA